MNALTKIFLLVTMMFNVAHAQVNSGDLKATLSKETLEPEEEDQAYSKLETLVQAKRSSVEMKELLEMCLLYGKHDESDASYDLIFDLRKSNKKEFDKALKQLSKKDRQRIQDIIKMTEGEIKNGNG